MYKPKDMYVARNVGENIIALDFWQVKLEFQEFIAQIMVMINLRFLDVCVSETGTVREAVGVGDQGPVNVLHDVQSSRTHLLIVFWHIIYQIDQ